MKAFPAPNLYGEAAYSFAPTTPGASTGSFMEAAVSSALFRHIILPVHTTNGFAALHGQKV